MKNYLDLKRQMLTNIANAVGIKTDMESNIAIYNLDDEVPTFEVVNLVEVD